MKRMMFAGIAIMMCVTAVYGYYNPETGRWLSRDPAGEVGGLHLYAYVDNDPVGYWDYLGLKKAVYVQRKWWIIPLPDKLTWELDEKEKGKIKELQDLIKCLKETKPAPSEGDRQKAIKAAEDYINAIESWVPSATRPGNGAIITFNFARYEGREPKWKELGRTFWEGFCCGFKAGLVTAAITTGEEGKPPGFDPSKREDQQDDEWHYHWHEAPHDKRGGAPHWDRGKKTGPKPRPQEWSPDGIHWFPK